ncbi:MAG: hypothetical protein EAZ55_14235 [Cytophagales bacterium]|nr:MAG: hypothetical protein EAZ55_14235 [Cytophagales bacterium]
MTNQHIQTTQHYTVGYNEIDCLGNLKITALAQYMQEIAAQNVAPWGLDTHELIEKGYAWVLARLQMEIQHLPKKGDVFEIMTYPKAKDKYFIYRAFEMYNQQKDLIATAYTHWTVIDLKKRTMIALPDFVKEQMITALEDFKPEKFPKFENITTPLISNTYQVQWYDLDQNMHTNNTIYLKWMVESMPIEVLQQKVLTKLEVMYKAESLWQETLLVDTQPINEYTFNHQIKNQQKDTLLLQAQTTWI